MQASCLALLSWTLGAQTQGPPIPPPVQTSITVTGELSEETPSNLTVVPAQVLRQLPGVNLDDRLRLVPGFTLFRRTSSLVANPTTQGVSLRGLGSTGASRTLVLWDGVPINDPFGGWVYWTRVDPLEISQVEVSRGATTSVFGDRSLSGAIGILSQRPEKRHLLLDYEGGTQDTNEVSAAFSQTWSKWALGFHSRAERTDGYYIVPKPQRGLIDRQAGVRFAQGDARADYTGVFNRISLKFDALGEQRENGTSLTENSTGLGTISLNYSNDSKAGLLSILAYHSREQLHATFSSINATRSVERLTSRQDVPAEATGGAAFFRQGNSRYNVLGGADFERDEGYSTDFLPAGAGQRLGGGVRFARGIFGQSNFNTGPFRLFLGTREEFTDAGRNFFAPSGGVAMGRKRWRLRAAAYRSFRTPTLNELYRDFRVGNTNTLANSALTPETLSGVEAGADYIGEKGRFSLGVYRNRLHNLISNVTLSSTPTLITRQRQNAAAALGRGIEAQATRRLGPIAVEANYLYADSRYDTGERIPQAPRHQGSFQLRFERKKFLFSGNVRSYGAQFDDDKNQFLLPGFASVQLYARQVITRTISMHAEVENALDRQYLVAFTPTPNIGNPRLIRVGVTLDIGKGLRP